MMRSVLKYWYMFLNPKYRIQGLLGFPYYVISEIVAPFVEFIAYITVPLAYFLGILNVEGAIFFILVSWGFISYLTIANMFINAITFNRYKHVNDILWGFVLAILEMFGFRQYTTLVRVFSSIHYFINRLRRKPL